MLTLAITGRRISRFLFASAAAALACSDSPAPSSPEPEPEPEPRVATSLAFQTQPIAAVKDSVVPVSVAVLDQDGKVMTTSTATVLIAIFANPGSAALTGSARVNAVQGIATFPNLRLTAVGVGYTLVALSGVLPPVTSGAFDVTLSLADIDGDGFSPNSGDCDDTNAARRPGLLDAPDGAYLDSNCDGVDGDVNNAAFVATTGVDNGACGTRVAPCRTIQFGLGRAASLGKSEVYLQIGIYAGAITLVDGISIYGRYDAQWQRAFNNVAAITGSNMVEAGGGEPQALTIYGANLTSPLTIGDVIIVGPAATGVTASGNGRSTHAVVLRDVPAGVLSIVRSKIMADTASSGASGTHGGGAPSERAMAGSDGGNSAQYDTTCDDTSRGAAGARGTNALVSGTVDPNGGAGGRGGTMDISCGAPRNLLAGPGEAGASAAWVVAGTFGAGGAFGPGSEGACEITPAPGRGGRVQNGLQGAPIPIGGRLISDFWYGFDGNAGGLGENGSGGGGGGGAGGCGDGIDAYGAGGGGGGAGGQRAPIAAGGGYGAGGAFAVYLINASPTISETTITLGRGGAGGRGGFGGSGQRGGIGGAGGAGGAGPGGIGGLPGGRGGDGAHGGHGAGGGGGGGGISVGVFRTSALSVPTLTAVVFEGGIGGNGGGGGEHASGTPFIDRDGQDGRTAVPGSVDHTKVCASPAGC